MSLPDATIEIKQELSTDETTNNDAKSDDDLEDIADLISRAEVIIAENRERMLRAQRQNAEGIRERAMAVLREPSVIELEDVNNTNPLPIETPEQPQIALNACNAADDDDVVFVACVQPPNQPPLIDLSTPEPNGSQKRRRRRPQLHQQTNNNASNNGIQAFQRVFVSTSTNPSSTVNPSLNASNAERSPKPKCPICLDNLRKTTSTLCGHIFCEMCIKACIQSTHKCPLCKRKLTRNSIHPVYFP